MATQEYDKYKPKHVEFWAALRSVADHELVEAQRRDASDRAHMRGEALPPAFVERGLHASVEVQVEGMLAGGWGRCDMWCMFLVFLLP